VGSNPTPAVFMKIVEDAQDVLKGSSFVGLDISKNRIGIAYYNHMTPIPGMLETYRRSNMSKDVEFVGNVIAENNPYCLIVGMPWDDRGRVLDNQKVIKHFIHCLRMKYASAECKIFFVNENYSTQNVTNCVDPKYVDSYVAASFIQDILGRQKSS
jgi:RNase H-fold protein (predicted Holliday junction resolvase)